MSQKTLMHPSTIVVVNTRGAPYTVDGFRSIFHKLRKRVWVEKKIGTGLTFHGLRHTVATKLANAGADNETIMALTGHKSPAMVKRYTEKADKKRRAKAAIRMIDVNE